MLPIASRRSDVADKDEDTLTDSLLDGAKAAAELIVAAATMAIAATFIVPVVLWFYLEMEMREVWPCVDVIEAR